MAGTKSDRSADKPGEVVVVPFAYPRAKDGQVVQLVKGDTIDADRYEKDSLEHLRSIGFIGTEK